MPPMVVRDRRWGVLAGLVAVTVVGGSLVPAGGAGAPIPLWDKLLHFLAYATLAGLLARVVTGPSARRAIVVAVVPTALGVVVELCQWPLATRTADPVDAAANAAGAGLVGLVVWLAGAR